MLVLKIRPGHDSKMTISIENDHDSKDKSQILEVTVAMAGSIGQTPREVCSDIIKKLAPVMDSLYIPVRGAPWLADLRGAAKLHRSRICVRAAT